MSGSSGITSLSEQLERLTRLRDTGAITAEEFESTKAQLLLGKSGAPTVAGRAAAPGVDPGRASAPRAAGPLASLERPETEQHPDLPADEFTLGDLHGEEEPEPPAASPPVASPGMVDPIDLDLGDDLGPLELAPTSAAPSGGDPAQLDDDDLVGVGQTPDGPAPGGDDDVLELDLGPPQPRGPVGEGAPVGPDGAGAPAEAPAPTAAQVQAPEPGPEPTAPLSQPPADASAPGMAPPPAYGLPDPGAAQRRAVQDLGPKVSRTLWIVGGVTLAVVLLLIAFSTTARLWFGGGLVVIGALVALAGGIWLLVEAARTSVLWLLLYLFVPFGNVIFVALNWAAAKRPFLTNLAGAGMILLGVLLFLNATAKSKRDAARSTDRSAMTSDTDPDDDDDESPDGPVRGRPVGGFSCRTLQDRVDDCEDVWVDQLERVLKAKGITVGTTRISADNARVAVRQAQTLVFERGELHRCRVAVRRRQPGELAWLVSVKDCFDHKRCEPFSKCHVQAFLKHIGQVEFSCRFYCNKEIFQCAGAMFAARLSRERGYRVRVDEDKLDQFRPQLMKACLKLCKRQVRTPVTKEKALQCLFQPTCKGFLSCVDKIQADE